MLFTSLALLTEFLEVHFLQLSRLQGQMGSFRTVADLLGLQRTGTAWIRTSLGTYETDPILPIPSMQ